MRMPFRISALLLLLAGCGSVEETTEEQVPPPAIPPPYIVRDSIRSEPPLSFRIQSDTVAAAGVPGTEAAPRSTDAPDIRFMVQIGSYRNAANAAAIQSRARERYGIPVMNEFDPARGLYQIRMGFFETREAAQLMRDRLVREHPSEYGDAWIVRLRP